ncbi:MAG: ABC transporter ATP-binding protein [Verrucomicrobia bacterium]|nr:ABC transporter ATP-binding protein [Verrucomicrobiota bacterium]
MENVINVLRFGWPYLRPYWRRLLMGVLLAAVFGFSNGIFVWATKTVFERLSPNTANPLTATASIPGSTSTWAVEAKATADRVLDPWLPLMGRPLDWKQVLGGLLLLPLPVFLRSVAGYLSGYCLMWAGERMLNNLRTAVLKKLNTLSLDYFHRSTMGDLLTRIHGDTTILRNCLSNGLSDAVRDPTTIVTLCATLCWIDWKLALAVMAFFSIAIIPIRLLSKKARKAVQGLVTASISQASLLVEAFTGIRVVKAFSLEGEQTGRFCHLSDQLVHHGMKGVQARGMGHPVIETISMFGVGMLVLWIIYSGQTIANIFGFLTGTFLLYQPVKRLAALNIMLSEASVSVNRLINIFKEQPTVKEPAQPKRLPHFTTGLRFENVSFSYGNQMVLQNINLDIPRGFKLGIAGESGCGKSTLINLLFRFYDPAHGRVTMDGIDLRELAGNDLRAQLALVSQEVVLFDLTVAENIACGRRGATRADVEQAARMADAHEFIMQLPQGYDTRIGERGVTLSGGQRQRLSIARAFIRNAPILLLDEATASLDSQSEGEVQAAIDRFSENRTVVTIAHRLSTLRACDRVIVLDQGRIVEQGAFTELLQKGGAFAAMAKRQGMLSTTHPA